jgi:hypothetical protein
MRYIDFLGLETIPVAPAFPVVLGACFELANDEQSAALNLSGTNAQSITLTIIHESRDDVNGFDLAGNDKAETLLVRDGEALIVLARREGNIVACGLYQVNLGCYESIGSLLIPVAVSNMELMQSDAAMTARILKTALDNLDDLEPTQKVEAVR